MASDKYNIQYTMLTIIQKSEQYLLALMKYHAQKARQESELAFYEGIYGQAISNPDAVRLAYVEDDLTTEAMKQIAAENGIHVEIDPCGHNFVIYDEKDEEALYKAVEEANRKEKFLFESNHFHENQYGYSCYKTGEFIPYVDSTGSYFDVGGHFHRGIFAGELKDDMIKEGLNSRPFNSNAIWNRDAHGILTNEFGRTISPVDAYGRFYNPDTEKQELTEAARAFYSMDANESKKESDVEIFNKNKFTMTEHGNMASQDGTIFEIPNEYGDTLHEDGTVTINKMYQKKYNERVDELRKRISDLKSGNEYSFDEDYNFISGSDNIEVKVLFRDCNGNYFEGGESKFSGPAQEYDNSTKNYYMDRNGNFQSLDGDSTVIVHNIYGDYIDKNGKIRLNYDVKNNIASRKEQIQNTSLRNDDYLYVMTEKGNFVKLGTKKGADGKYPENSVIIIYDENSGYIDESDGIYRVYDTNSLEKAAMENREVFVRCPGGYNNGDNFVHNYNEYGDYYSPETGDVVLNSYSEGKEAVREQRILASEKAPVNEGHSFTQTLNGNLEDIAGCAIVPLRKPDGSRCLEMDGYVIPGEGDFGLFLHSEEGIEIPYSQQKAENREDEKLEESDSIEDVILEVAEEEKEEDEIEEQGIEEEEIEETSGEKTSGVEVQDDDGCSEEYNKQKDNKKTHPENNEDIPPADTFEPLQTGNDTAPENEVYYDVPSQTGGTEGSNRQTDEMSAIYPDNQDKYVEESVDSVVQKSYEELALTVEHNQLEKKNAAFTEMGESIFSSTYTKQVITATEVRGSNSTFAPYEKDLSESHVKSADEINYNPIGVYGRDNSEAAPFKSDHESIPRYTFAGTLGGENKSIEQGHQKDFIGGGISVYNSDEKDRWHPSIESNHPEGNNDITGMVGNTVTLNREALGRQDKSADSGNDDKAARFGFENLTAAKKYGFHSMAPVSNVNKPSAEGLIGSFAGGLSQLAYGGTKDSHFNMVRYTRTIGAAFNAIGGRTIYRNAVKTSGEYFLKLQKSGGISSVNSVLSMHGYKAVDFTTASGIKTANESLMNIAGRYGLVEIKGRQFVVKDLSDKALFRLGAGNPADAAKLRNAIKTAITQKNALNMVKSGKHVLYYSARISLMSSDDGTLGYLGQGADAARVAAQTYKAVQDARRSSLLNKHLKYKKNETLLRKPSPDITAKEFRNRFIKRRSLLNGRSGGLGENNGLQNVKAVQQYRELRQRETAQKWNQRHRHSEIKYNRMQRAEKARLEKLAARKQAGNAVRRKLTKPIRYAKGKLLESRIGLRVAAVKKWVVSSKPYKIVASAQNAISTAYAKALEKISKFVNAIARKLMLIVGIYLIACIALAFISALVLVPLTAIMSAETNDEELSGGVAMEDVYDKSNTMTGIIYNELRHMEVQWASETRTYGTTVNPLSLNEVNFTEYNVSARQYALCQTGADDLLGVWAYDTTKETGGKKYEGILGPEPFDGASLEDYKLLRDIDGGNTLELRGKPQEGFTSNAKQITTMASVFFGQTLDTLREESNSAKGVSGFLAKAKRLWKAAWTYFETNDVPILGWIAKHTGWSWTSVYRNYAYPLMQASHQENFFLSSYIYPTEYTQESETARWDGVKGGNPDKNGDQTSKVDQVTGAKAKNGRVGVETEGGSGKVTSGFLVSDDIYQGYGDDGWEAIELCPEGQYGGYGCQKRLSFAYKYSGHFATDGELSVTHSDELSTLYYGGDPDSEGEYDNTSDVSADVSPWDNDEDAGNGYNRDSCIIHILKITDEAAKCWTLDSSDPLDDYNFEVKTDLLEKTFYSDDMNEKYLNRPVHDNDDEDNLTIQKITETDIGCDVYVSYPFEERIVTDPNTGLSLKDENDDPITETIYTNDGFILHFKHECQSDHMGVYCGGHLQLRTRGIIYGFSEEQQEEGTIKEEGTLSKYAPKYLDPIYYNSADGDLPSISDVEETEKAAYPDLDVWKIDEHSLPDSDDDTPYIEDEKLKKMYLAKDIFDIDSMILRRKDSYPGYSTADESMVSEGVYSPLWKWTGWTLTNMGNAVTLAASDWYENYALADTQTAVGGIYNTASNQYLNSLNNDLKNKILKKIGAELNMHADILDPEAVGLDGEPMTDEERVKIDQVRHVQYALESVGKVNYSQLAHANLYGNVAGHATDCSGFVSNIWRDRLDASLTVAALFTNGYVEPKEYHGPETQGIEPGDIILVNPSSSDSNAHALIYIGKFTTSELYGGDEGDERVYTVDCSSMVLTTDDLASQEDTPIKSWFTDADGGKLSLKDGYRNYENNGKSPMVRSGNVRFCDREYVNSNTAEMYYLDMSEWPRIGQRQLVTDFSDLGDTTVGYWDKAAVISDLTQTREEKDIEFPISVDVTNDPVEDVDIPEDDWREPEDEPDDPVRDGRSVILDMNQYINQGSGSWAQIKRGGIGSNQTIQQAGCIDCSYLMAASYYNNATYNVGEILSNPRYYSGNSFLSGPFMSDYGLGQTIHSGYSQQGIQDAIDMGYPVILHIQGSFSFHPKNSGHFLVIMGYNDDGFMLYDPGKNANSYCVTGNVIPYRAFSNGPGRIPEYRVITKK